MPVQNFNNTRHDYEITLEPSSIVELCPDEEAVIPKIQYHVSSQLNPKPATAAASAVSSFAIQHVLRVSQSTGLGYTGQCPWVPASC